MKKQLVLIILLSLCVNYTKGQWIVQNNGINIGTVRDSYFLNENVGWLLVNGNKIYKTSDGGDEWTSIDTMAYYVDAIHFVDSLHGWGTGYNRIINTQNGGYSWSIQYDSLWDQIFRDVYFLDTNTGWVIGSDRILSTHNGGNSWQNDSLGLFSPWSVFFINKDTGWVVGEHRILKTTNGGQNWLIKLYSGAELASVTFIDENRGWAVGETFTSGWQSVVHRSIDGGETWDYLQLPGGQALYSVSFSDSLNGWIAGSYGTIWHTNDGGQNWELQESNTDNYLYTISFMNNFTGWATGEEGIILKTLNGGTVGIHQNNLSNNPYISIIPNPATEYINVRINGKYSELEIFNLSGNLIWKCNIKQSGIIDIRGFSKGVYILKIYTDDEMLTRKFIKK